MKRRDEVTVGILITVAAIVVVLGSLWLARGGLKSGYPLYTRFAWGQNLKQGQPVLLAGVSVGYVGDVTLRRNGYLDVMLRIDDQFTVPKGSTATVKPVGIFGDVAVALTPPTPVPAASYVAGDTVPPGPASADIGQIMSRVDSIGQSVSMLMQAVQTQVVEAGTLKDLHKTIVSAAALSGQLQAVVIEQNKNLTETMGSFRDAAGRMSRVVDSAQVEQATVNLRRTSENLVRFSANLDSTNAQLRSVLDEAQHGNGNVAKLLGDTLLYHNLVHSIASMDSLLADIKAHPGKYINVKVF
jgi:phospholipid/cholesterol/gamma-HCH transport system substrate-binding protein